MHNKERPAELPTYNSGDRDDRPWGFYEVLEAGTKNAEEFCIKRIGVQPKKALSLQRHQGRQEVWTVEQGTLTVILDGKVHTLGAGDEIIIPKTAAHCMINQTDEPVLVKELQTGICREDDNERLYDINGRQTQTQSNLSKQDEESILLYRELTDNL